MVPPPAELDRFLRELKPVVSEAVYRTACLLVELVRRFVLELDKKRASVMRLRKLVFGSSTEKTSRLASPDKDPAEKQRQGTRCRGNPKGKGHGRNSLKRQFPGATRHLLFHPELSSGSCCGPDCSGRMNVLNRVRTTARVFGQALLPMHIWEQQGLRCSACQRIDWAPLPPEAEGSKYDPTACSMLAVMHYGNGMPRYRIAEHQRACGVPVPETVQWELLAGLADEILPVYEALLDHAACGEVLYNDDTYRTILSRLLGLGAVAAGSGEASRGKKERTGTFTTAIVSQSQGQTIALYFTGSQHAGENLRDLLQRRPEEHDKPIQMCDGLSRNLPSNCDTVVCNCLSHGRRKVAELHAVFPEAVQHVLDELQKIYRVDAQARKAGLSDEERLRLHRQESLPVLDTLCGWLEAQFDDAVVEPNSSLGQAFEYLLSRWYQLTQFTRVPGAPVDNNVCERILKMAIRHRKSSLFYKTQRGAEVGDRLMSLIHTCTLAGVDPFGYLTALQQHHKAAAADPEAWLPWNYEEALAAATATAKVRQPVAVPVTAPRAPYAEGSLATPPPKTTGASVPQPTAGLPVSATDDGHGSQRPPLEPSTPQTGVPSPRQREGPVPVRAARPTSTAPP